MRRRIPRSRPQANPIKAERPRARRARARTPGRIRRTLMSTDKKATLIRLGSRGSALALTQANMVKGWLEEANPGLTVTIEIIKTEGDLDQGTPLVGFDAMGIFVKQIQAALLEGRIDAAVHSLKDVPEEQPEGLLLASFPEREDARDVFI